jgi:hypothetical protein
MKNIIIDGNITVNGKKSILGMENPINLYTKEGIDTLITIQAGPQGVQGVQGIAGIAGAVGPAGLEWEGAWDVSTAYVVDDAVSDGGSSYFCIADVTGGNAPSTNASWALLASQGATGLQGVQGVQGIQGLTGGATMAIDSLTDALTSANNLGLGSATLTNLTSGRYNTGVGINALTSNTNGERNTGVGYGSNYVNVSGSRNTAIGMYSLNLNTASDNTGVGESALASNTTGTLNTAIGMKAGALITTGSSNIMIGANVDAQSATSSNQLNIGDWIYGAAGDIGIGVLAPTAKLDVNGAINATSFKVTAMNTAPSSATDTGTLGEIRVVADFIYVCTATDTWVRSALATW